MIKMALRLGLIMLLLAGCQEAPVDWDRVDDGVIRLVVISGQDVGSTGSAFAINAQGYYVTNHHVIEAALQGAELVAVESVSPTKKSHPARVVWSSAEKDLAIVQVPAWPRPPLPLTEESLVKKKQTVVTLGFPGASDFDINDPSFTEPKQKQGVISARHSRALQPNASRVDLFEHDATINSGNSGGPLVDACGRVVGVNVAKATTQLGLQELTQGVQQGALQINLQEGTFFSVRVNELRQALQDNDIAFQLKQGRCIAPGAGLPVWQTAMLGLMAVMLLGLSFGYLRLRRNAPAGQVNSRYLSALIRDKLGKSKMDNDKKNQPPRLVRGPDGRVIRMGGSKRLLPEQKNWPAIELSGGQRCVIGRDPNQCDIAIEHEEISRQHMALLLDDQGEVRVMDLGSSNGTYLDHTRVAVSKDEASAATLGPKQRLILGSEDVVYKLADD